METILVVDEPASSKLLTEMLSGEGYEVRHADNGQVALAAVAAKPPNLILVDLGMPPIEGFELCRRLKRRKETASIPLIFIGAATDPRVRVEGLLLGAVDFVSKPFQHEELLARVGTHMELGRLRGDLEIQVERRTAELRAAVLQLQREIDDRTQAEEALRESEERFRNMANTAPVLIWVSGPEKLGTFFNTSWLNFTGRTMEQELGDGWTESVHPDDLDRFLEVCSSSFNTRRAFRVEYRLRRADGEYRWVIDEGVPRVQSGGEFLGYIGSCIDVTDVRQAQEEALGRERVESLRVLAGGIAHDFTNLMGSILAIAELAQNQLPGGSPAGEDIRRIEIVASRAVEMARELMIYAGRDNGNFELLDLSQIVEDMAEILKTSIPKSSGLTIDLPQNLPVIWGNPTHIRQIVMNLIINAAEAIGGAAGAIHIRSSRLPDGPEPDVRPSGIAPDVEYLRLTVSDTGCGMTNEQLTRIFDPFFTTKGTGHGLGLSVVQGIVHSHGGVINVRSAPGKGTTFEILLPCAMSHAGHTTSLSCQSSA